MMCCTFRRFVLIEQIQARSIKQIRIKLHSISTERSFLDLQELTLELDILSPQLHALLLQLVVIFALLKSVQEILN